MSNFFVQLYSKLYTAMSIIFIGSIDRLLQFPLKNHYLKTLLCSKSLVLPDLAASSLMHMSLMNVCKTVDENKIFFVIDPLEKITIQPVNIKLAQNVSSSFAILILLCVLTIKTLTFIRLLHFGCLHNPDDHLRNSAKNCRCYFPPNR